MVLNAIGPAPFDVGSLVAVGRQGLADGFQGDVGEGLASLLAEAGKNLLDSLNTSV